MDTVRQIMTTAVVTAKPSDVIGPLRDLMLDKHIGCVPIVDDAGGLQGIVTSNDLVEEWAPQMGVQTVMTRDVLTVPPNRSVSDAAREMVARHVHHAVVAERGEVVGVVSSFDVMMMLAGRLEEAQTPEGKRVGLKAHVGDKIVVRGLHVGERERRAVIEEVRGTEGGPPYLVRWLSGADERQHLYFPGTDAVIEPK